MKKNLLLTLVLVLLCTTAGWAQFAPEEGKLYALREITKGYYLDIQTKGMTDNDIVTNNISLNTTPCIIYFEAGANGTWKMKNANGEYVCVGSSHWNPTVGGTTAHEWKVDGEIDKLTFQRQNNDATGYIGANNIETGVSLYNNQTVEAKIFKFSLIDLGDTHDYYNMKAVNGGNITNATGTTYFSFNNATVGGVTTQASYSTTPANLYIPQTLGRIAIFEDKDNHYYINHTENDWNITKSNTPALYVIGEPDANNYVLISKKENSNHNIGHDGGSNANINTEGTGIFTNVAPANCHKWELVKHNVYESTVPTLNATDIDTIQNYGQYLTKLTLKGITIFSDLAQPTVAADMYVLGGNSGVVLEPGSEYTLSLTFPQNQTSQILAANLWFDKDGDGTYETHLGTTGQEGSNSNNLTTVTFTVPSDASNCFTSIRLRLDSSWGIAATPDADANRMVYDFPVTITIPPVYTFNVVNPSGENVSVTYNGNPINNDGEITGGVKKDLFIATDVEGYEWYIVVDPDTKTVTLVYEKKYTWSIVDLPDGATITYNNNAVADGGFGGTDYDSQYLTVTCPNGYTWEIARDDENKIVTITFTQLQGAENPQAVVDLINRIGGAGTSDKFQFVLDPSLNYAKEVFVISGDGNKVLIKGTTISAITTGIGWYLQNIARINIAWNSLNEKTVSGDAYADLSNIPLNVPEKTHTSDAMYRYYLNTCVFGYSMTTWTWKRWQQEIDWMALHGVNMPLQLVGLEEVWRKFLTMEDGSGNRKYKYSDEQAKAFVPGPAFIAWWAMNNLQGWGGTGKANDINANNGNNGWDGSSGVQNDAWYERQKKLAQDILERQRDLGMQPVLPGWSGMVPANFASISGYATRPNGGWNGGFVRPLLLNVSNANYGEIAADYYKCLHEVMGESQYYSMDPFHEGGGAGTMEDYEAMYAAMEAAKPGSQWVIQQWQWSATQRLSLTAVPAGRLIVLDLFADGKPAFDTYNGFAPQDAVFSIIPNFGGRSGLMGRLTNLTDNYFKYKAKYASIKGIGAAPEAIEQTPVTYDLLFQLAWMDSKPDVAEWVDNYAIARYGQNNEEIKEAWSLLRQSVLNYGADAIQGPVEDVWAAIPNLTATPASTWGTTLNDAIATYTPARHQMLIDATYKLISQSSVITPGTIYESNYNYDLVELGGGVLADYAYYLLKGISAAKTAAGDAYATDETFVARKNAFLDLIEDVDAFKGTNLNFRLGKWTQEARAAAAEVEGATSATADWYEYNNARTIISTWSSPDATTCLAGFNARDLNDYSYRSWQGMMKDYYLPRWKHYFDNGCTNVEYDYFEWNWAHGMVHEVGQTAVSNVALAEGDAGHTDSYTREPEGNTVEKATEVLGKYIIPVKTKDNGNYYAYRYLTNESASTCTIVLIEGSENNIADIVSCDLTGATMTAGCIDGTASNLTNVAVKSETAGNSYNDAVITFTDGTVLKLTIEVQSAEFYQAKAELAALIGNVEELIGKIAEVESTVSNIPLQVDNSNAEGYIYSNATIAEGALSDLLDDDNESYIHTAWSGNTADGENHYLRVYLGENPSLNDFTFSYVTRNNDNTERPKQITVAGCATVDGEYATIATITGIPSAKATTFNSEIYNAAGYKYLRFMVDDTHRDLDDDNGHKAYSMAKFELCRVNTTVEVAPKYKNLAGVTNEETATVYDCLVEALYVYNNGGTADEMQAAYDALKPLYDALDDKVDNIFNGVYNINFNNVPVFVAYLEGVGDLAGANDGAYRLFDGAIAHDGAPDGNTDDGHIARHQSAIDAKAVADALFTIVPNSNATGYTISAQELYLEQTYVGWWGASAFSSDKEQAGVYLFEEIENEIYKLKCATGDWVPYVNDWGYVFGNNTPAETYSTFTLTQVTEYTLNVPTSGFTTLCLPFNVVLPAGVTAYDLAEANLTNGGLYHTYELATVATEGETLAKNTPVIVKATAGDYVLTITMDDEDAKASTAGTLLRSALVKTTIEAGNKYIYDGENFNRVTAATEIAANQCWMELGESKGDIIYGEAPAYVLTTDEENPVLYNIQINRSYFSPTYLQYNERSGVVNIAAGTQNASYQAWYFMEGTDGAVLIKPYNGDGKVLGADDNGNGATKVWAVENGTKNICEWTIEKNGEWYNILGDGKCFSNNGGNSTNTMGFYNDKNDNGSKFKFLPATFENDNPRFYQMKDLNAQTTTNGYIVGESVGFYSIDAINEKKAAATALEEAGSATSSAADCYAAYKALRTAVDEAYIAPDPAKVYYIVSASTSDYCAGKYVHTINQPIERTSYWGTNTYTHEHLLFADINDITHKQLAAFQFEETGVVGEYKMKSLNSGLYVKSFAGTHMGTEAEAQAVKIAPYATGQLTLKVGNNAPMHAQNDYSVIVQYAAEENGASLWIINEVTDATDFDYTLTVPANGIATLYLPFNVTLPKGVTAYTVDPDHILEKGDGTYYYDELTQVAVADDKLAKGTAVIIKAAAGEYTFKATFDDTDAITAAASALVGTYYKQTISTGYSMAVENNEPIFNGITADTAVEPYSCWLVADGITTDKIGSNVEFKPVEIEDGKVYRIYGRLSNGTLRTLYNNGAKNQIKWTSEAKSDASTLFVAKAGSDGKFTLASALANGYWNQDAMIGENGVELTFVNGSVSSTAMILGENERRFCADDKGTLNYYSNVAGDPASAYVNENVTTDFVFELVEDVTVSYTARIAKGFAYATLYLPYAVTVPDGITAYVAHTPTSSLIQLTEAQDVIPARTPVVLKRDATDVTGDYVFECTADSPTNADELDALNNILTGYLIETLVEGQDGCRYYMLMKYGGSEKFFWILKEYDENGKLYTDGQDHTHIKCSANKAFLEMSESQASSSYSFQLPGTTGIDEVETEGVESDAIYDLHGRKIIEPVKGSIYIKNGKVFIAK